MRFRRKQPDAVLAVRESPVSNRVARLVRKDGRVMCECPYLCDAVSEPCEFDGLFDAKGRALTDAARAYEPCPYRPESPDS